MDTIALDTIAPFEFQLATWGYDTAGRVAELTAMLSEQPDWREMPNGYPLWDHTADWLDGIKVCHGEAYHAPPQWWALPHVVELAA